MYIAETVEKIKKNLQIIKIEIWKAPQNEWEILYKDKTLNHMNQIESYSRRENSMEYQDIKEEDCRVNLDVETNKPNYNTLLLLFNWCAG